MDYGPPVYGWQVHWAITAEARPPCLFLPPTPRGLGIRSLILPEYLPAPEGGRSMASAGTPASSHHRPRRFAVLRTGRATDYTERTHGGYGQMLARLLQDQEPDQGGEVWDIFSLIDGDFSFLDRDGGDYYDAYVITGSSADAHATDVDWINRLSGVLVLLHLRKKRLLGICFGHQILARALGGKTGRAEVGWEIGVKSLRIDSEKVLQLYGLAFPSTVRAIESHRDQVLILPPGAVLLASSDRTKIEMFAVDDNVLCMQCHPEFTEDVMVDIIQNRFGRNTTDGILLREALESFKTGRVDEDQLQLLCKTFLKKCL